MTTGQETDLPKSSKTYTYRQFMKEFFPDEPLDVDQQLSRPTTINLGQFQIQSAQDMRLSNIPASIHELNMMFLASR